MVVHVRRLAIFIGGVLCILPVLAAHAVPIKANTPAAVALASATRHADILIFPKGKAEVSIPFTLVNGVPITSAIKINGKFLGRFIIDTGARASFIDRRLANQYRLPVALQLHMMWKGHRIDIRRISRLQLGPIIFENDCIGTAGLSKVRNPVHQIEIGSIGGDVLGQFPFAIDYRSSRLVIYNPKSFCPPAHAVACAIHLAFNITKSKSGARAAKLFFRFGVPIVSGMVNGRHVPICPDTGTTFPAGLMPMFIHKHPMLVNWQHFIQFIRDVQLRGQMFGTHNATVSIFGQRIDHPDQVCAIAASPWQLAQEKFTDPALVVGGRFLRNYRLTFDYAAKKMWVQRNPPLSYQAQLADGLNPNQSDPTGETPLMHAGFQGDLVGVTALLHAGANPLAKDKSGHSVLDYAAMGGNSEIVKLLLAGATKREVNSDANGWTAIDYAFSGTAGVTTWDQLVKAGANINPGPNPAMTPLIAALQYDNMAAVRWLVKHGANVNAANSQRETPLSLAVFSGNYPALRLLRQHGAVLDTKDPHVGSPLFAAAAGGHVAMVKLLLSEAGTDFTVNGRNSFGETPLMLAAAKGHIATAKFLLRHGADVGAAAPARENQTALLFAAQHEQPKMLNLLIRHGANVNAANSLGATALMVAAAKANVRDVLALLRAGANVNAHSANDASVLEMGAASGCGKIVKILLSHGAKANVADSSGFTPLMTAAEMNGPTAVLALIQAGADVNVTAVGEAGSDALDYAAQAGNPKVVEMLLQHGANANATNLQGTTPLMGAAAGGNAAIVQALVKAGANVDAAGPLGQTPLMIAASAGNFRIAQVLINVGAKVGLEAAGKYAMDALDFAARKGAWRIVDLLVRHGAKINSTDSLSRTPLMIATGYGHFRAARVLVTAGASVNVHAPKNYGWTVLEYAAAGGNPRVVDLLVRHGAPVNGTDNLGQTPLMLAASEGHFRVVQVLVNAGADVGLVAAKKHKKNALDFAAASGDWRIVELLVRHGAKVNVPDSVGLTPLMFAAGYDHLRAISALIQAGAKLNLVTTGKDGTDALAYAAGAKQIRAVRLLLEHGANPNVRDSNGLVPLVNAAYYGSIGTASALVNAGANVNLADRYGMTPLDYACLAKHPSAMVALLLKAGANPKLKDKKGRNALYYARKSGSAKAVALVQAAIGQTIAPPASRKQAAK